MSMIVNPYVFGGATNNTTSLLHFDGSNGSTTFTDQAGITWTGNGNAQLSTAQQQFGASSLLLDGVGDYLTNNSAASFSILGDFTIECWVRRTATGRDAILTSYGTSASGFLFDIGASDDLRLILGTGSFISCSSGATTIPANTWTHVTGVRSGSNLAVYVAGVQSGTLAITGTVADGGGLIYLGRDPLDTARDFGGYIDEFRFSNTARYTSNFTPTGPFTYPD